MKPIEFEGQNATFAKHQKEYIPLPAHISDGIATSCWELSLFERVKVLVTGKIWVSILNHNRPLQPQKLQVDRPEWLAGGGDS